MNSQAMPRGEADLTFPLRKTRPSPHVGIVLPGLGAGGTERVVKVLANEWAGRGWKVTIHTFESPGTRPYYRFDPGVEIKQLGLPPAKGNGISALIASAKRTHRLRRALIETQPDVLFSFLTRTNVMALAASWKLGFEVVVSERNNPSLQDIGPIWRFLRKATYPRAFGLVTMTAGALNHFPARMRRRSWVIPNPVDPPESVERNRGGKTLTAVGRLVPQKGFDLLLQAFAQLGDEFADWNLVIWGEGPNRAALEAERRRLGLDGRVALPGVTAKPGVWVDTADVFVLSSRFEGWGIVLLEAMAADLPVVSFDCEWGPRQMVEDGENGILVESGNVAALAAALRRVLADGDLRGRLGAAAGVTARKFTPRRIADEWQDVAETALAERAAGRG